MYKWDCSKVKYHHTPLHPVTQLILLDCSRGALESPCPVQVLKPCICRNFGVVHYGLVDEWVRDMDHMARELLRLTSFRRTPISWWNKLHFMFVIVIQTWQPFKNVSKLPPLEMSADQVTITARAPSGKKDISEVPLNLFTMTEMFRTEKFRGDRVPLNQGRDRSRAVWKSRNKVEHLLSDNFARGCILSSVYENALFIS